MENPEKNGKRTRNIEGEYEMQEENIKYRNRTWNTEKKIWNTGR